MTRDLVGLLDGDEVDVEMCVDVHARRVAAGDPSLTCGRGRAPLTRR